MNLPLHLKLKKKVHQTIAYAQDLIIEEIYHFFPKAVLHGGTAIWRCYQGNRFSEDIDVYLSERGRIDEFFASLGKKGFRILKKRVKANSLYSLLEFDRVQVRFEAVFKKISDYILKEYETAESTLINVYTLSPQELLEEKVAACLKRKKIRDLYDIFFLLRFVEEVELPVAELISVRIVDEENLQTLIISGPIPSLSEIKRYIKEWAE